MEGADGRWHCRSADLITADEVGATALQDALKDGSKYVTNFVDGTPDVDQQSLLASPIALRAMGING